MKLLLWLSRVLKVKSVREYELLDEVITLKERIAKQSKKISRLRLQLTQEQTANDQERADFAAIEQQLRTANDRERLEWEQERRKLEVKVEVQKAEIELWQEVNERNRVRIESESAKAAGEIATALGTKPKNRG